MTGLQVRKAKAKQLTTKGWNQKLTDNCSSLFVREPGDYGVKAENVSQDFDVAVPHVWKKTASISKAFETYMQKFAKQHKVHKKEISLDLAAEGFFFETAKSCIVLITWVGAF